MAIYLVIRQIAVHKTQIGVMVKEILQLVGLYLWGFALSLVIFLPSVAGFFTSSRSDVSKSAFDLFYKASYYTKLVTRFVSSDPAAIIGQNWGWRGSHLLRWCSYSCAGGSGSWRLCGRGRWCW